MKNIKLSEDAIRDMASFFATSLPRWLELSLIVCVLLVIFCTGILDVSFHPDESQWIATSYAFEDFVNGEFASPTWDESHWTLTQPPVTRYVIALGRLAGGYHVADLNLAWSWGMDALANIARGAMPSPSLLWWSRLPMAVLSVVCGLILFKLADACAGRVAGYALLLLFAGNPYLLYTLRRAMGEASLLVCVILVAFAGDQALSSWRRVATNTYKSVKALFRPLTWFIIMGIFCGVAGAAKLNGISAAPAGLMLCVLTPLAQKGNIPKSVRLYFIICACAAILLAAGITFVALNPYLYPDALGRTEKMFLFRLQEMHKQQSIYPEYRIHGIDMRIPVVWQRVCEDYAAIRFGGARVVNILLCTVGAFYLMRQAWRWLRSGVGPGTSIVIILIALTTATPSLLTPLDWDRYFLLPVVFSSVCIAIGISWVIKVSRKWVQHKNVRGQPSDMRGQK